MIETKYEVCGQEMWRLRGPDGKESYHVLPFGRLAPELQKLGERVPIPPEYEEALKEEQKRLAKKKSDSAK
jgi:hypothetical protein